MRRIERVVQLYAARGADHEHAVQPRRLIDGLSSGTSVVIDDETPPPSAQPVHTIPRRR
jgi:hypothetical protein